VALGIGLAVLVGMAYQVYLSSLGREPESYRFTQDGDAASTLYGIVTTLFVLGWVIGACVGEISAARSLKQMIIVASGYPQVLFNPTELRMSVTVKNREEEVSSYSLSNIDGFDLSYNHRLFFRYGVRRIYIEDITENEAEWLEQEFELALAQVRGGR
jgi:hypothetical protein